MQTTSRSSIRDVAVRAGVSAVTVSNVLRGRSSRASVETRERVLEAARSLNYVPVAQPTTQSRKSQTQVIGLVFDQVTIKDMWGFPTFLGLQTAGLEHGYDLLTILRARAEWMSETDVAPFLDRRTDGFIFVVPTDRYSVLETLVEHQIPAVVCFTDEAPAGVPAITLDNYGAMRLTTEHLIEQGHRRILHLTRNNSRSDFKERCRGYEEAMQKAGQKPLVLLTKPVDDSDSIAEIIATIKKHKITAIACSTDMTALAVWDIVTAHGHRVPQELSITGLDDLPEVQSRGLTTVRFSCEDVGRYAMEAIMQLREGVDWQKCNRAVPVELVPRTSVASPP
jgi:LacI family transcriptional regulator